MYFNMYMCKYVSTVFLLQPFSPLLVCIYFNMYTCKYVSTVFLLSPLMCLWLLLSPPCTHVTGSEDDALDDDDDVTPLAESELRARVQSMLDKNPNMGMIMDDRSLSQMHKKSIKPVRKSLK